MTAELMECSNNSVIHLYMYRCILSQFCKLTSVILTERLDDQLMLTVLVYITALFLKHTLQSIYINLSFTVKSFLLWYISVRRPFYNLRIQYWHDVLCFYNLTMHTHIVPYFQINQFGTKQENKKFGMVWLGLQVNKSTCILHRILLWTCAITNRNKFLVNILLMGCSFS